MDLKYNFTREEFPAEIKCVCINFQQGNIEINPNNHPYHHHSRMCER